VLQLGAGQEADFYALLQCRGDAAQHLQGVAIVVRIFEPGDNGLGRANLACKLGLGELGLRDKAGARMKIVVGSVIGVEL